MSKPHATKIDLFVIAKVRDKRKELNISQLALSQSIGAADSFVSSAESLKYRTKYNIRHLNELARVFNCSPKIFGRKIRYSKGLMLPIFMTILLGNIDTNILIV